MLKILRSNSIKSISSRSNPLSSPSKSLATLTANQLADSSDSKKPETLSSALAAGSSKMLPINKLAHDITKKRYSTQQYTAEEIAKIREAYQKFEELGQDLSVPTPWGKRLFF